MKVQLNSLLTSLLDLEKQGKGATLLGIGPMSSNLIIASLELARDGNFPIMFIASRNQVDSDEFGAGYVNGWNQDRFAQDIQNIANDIGFTGSYYLCRDHGGPWQRDEERNNHIPKETAMAIAKQSYLEDILAGFDLLMIDPTKDPFEVGKVIPLEAVIDMTVELIEYCESERRQRNLPEIAYEVGTEETNGGLTSTERYEEFIQELNRRLDAQGLPHPSFIVGQTGTLTRKTEQVGTFNFNNAQNLATMAASYGVSLKEHNGDYLSDETLLLHRPTMISAVNVAPQYGTQETQALITLTNVETLLHDKGAITNRSQLYDILLTKAIDSERWKKWVIDPNITVETIKKDPELSLEILDIAGHYTFNDPDIIRETTVLYQNLSQCGIDGKRYVIESIKQPIHNYAVAFNLINLFDRI
ncbi:class II D-tagatose-bisphosphate aldolase non-catalytic subunit [Erysipelothrix anatis]|uniref:class II D-tagatose-bisphosphate aldolase non-catalytic subunit n=1 Tax=Erysipelothrix anatis TaxID=2683713 RepID=UPI0013578B18|nr:class II D-tagatose-bisphosphate aldolase, non-catalytic subunit [Erysipelothrix anatis]